MKSKKSFSLLVLQATNVEVRTARVRVQETLC